MREIIAIIVFIVACYSVSWALTVGIIKLITMCFSWDFSLSVATGVWLILCILKLLFYKSGDSK